MAGVAFSAGRRYLAHLDSHLVVVRDANTLGRQIVVGPMTNLWVRDLALGQDESLVAASGDGSVVVFDLTTGRERAVLRGHQGQVNQVAVSPDGTTVATAGEDGSVRLWNIATGHERLRLYGHTGPVSGVAFSRLTRSLTEQERRDYFAEKSCPDR